LQALGRHSLLRVTEQVIEAHRLVQAVAWDRMSGQERARQAARAVRLLEAAFPQESQEVRTWGDCRALQPHADHVARLAESCRAVPELVGELLDRVGVFDWRRARHADAADRLLRVIAIKEAALGPEHPGVALTLGHLGLVARHRGELGEARELQG